MKHIPSLQREIPHQGSLHSLQKALLIREPLFIVILLMYNSGTSHVSLVWFRGFCCPESYGSSVPTNEPYFKSEEGATLLGLRRGRCDTLLTWFHECGGRIEVPSSLAVLAGSVNCESCDAMTSRSRKRLCLWQQETQTLECEIWRYYDICQ